MSNLQTAAYCEGFDAGKAEGAAERDRLVEVLGELLREHECLLISIGNDGTRLSTWHKQAKAALAAARPPQPTEAAGE